MHTNNQKGPETDEIAEEDTPADFPRELEDAAGGASGSAQKEVKVSPCTARHLLFFAPTFPHANFQINFAGAAIEDETDAKDDVLNAYAQVLDDIEKVVR